MKEIKDLNRSQVRRLLLKSWYPPYWDEGDRYHRSKGWRTKRYRKEIMSFQYRAYRTWKYNRLTAYKH